MGSLLDASATVEMPSGGDAADTTHEKNLIFRTANSATAVAPAVDIPVNLRGRFWRLLTVGANVQFQFILDGDVTPAGGLVYNQASVMGTGHKQAAPTYVDSIPDHIWCPVKAKRYTFISSAASGFVEACVSGERTGK